MIRSALQRLMYGRYGNDQLNMALLVLYLALFLAYVLTDFELLYWLSFALLAVSLFRLLSRNHARRRAVPVHDSKHPRGAAQDRNARIGEGYLGSEELGGGLGVFAAIVSHPALRDLPFILETPNELDGYAREIALLRGLSER